MKLVSSTIALLCALLPISVLANPVIDMVFPVAEATVPEPTTLALLAIGAGAAGVSKYTRKRKK